MHPFTPRLTKQQINFIIISIHLTSLSIIVPYVNFLKLQDHECLEKWPKLGYRQAYTLVLFMAQYALPLLFMSTMYALALIKLYKVTSNATQMRIVESQHSRKIAASPRTVSANSRNASVVFRKISLSSQFTVEATNNSSGSSRGTRIRRLSSRVVYNMRHGCDLESNVRVTKMFIAIVAIFAIFMLPNQIVWLWIDFGGGQRHFQLNTIKIICWLFTYTNCVCNPFIFITFFKDFRSEVLALPRRLWKRPSSFRLSISRSSGVPTEYSRDIPSASPASPVSILSTLNENGDMANDCITDCVT